jgi:repressor of nif and glnA expression
LRATNAEFELAPTHRAILEVIVDAGVTATQSIPAKMAIQFANPRSINLAVKTMEERGLIRREGKHARNGILWTTTEKGLSELKPRTAFAAEETRASLRIIGADLGAAKSTA